MQKEKYQIEYLFKTSVSVLYGFISSPSGLSEWFADDVNIKNKTYTFFWEGSEEQAELLTVKNNEYIKFKWEEDEDEKSFFEFRIKVDPLTKEVALIITDFAEEDEIDDAKDLWNSQVGELKRRLGS